MSEVAGGERWTKAFRQEDIGRVEMSGSVPRKLVGCLLDTCDSEGCEQWIAEKYGFWLKRVVVLGGSVSKARESSLPLPPRLPTLID